MKPRTKIKFGLAATMLSALLVFMSCSQKENFYSNVLRADIFTQNYNPDKYDFLWVIDNSPSMAPKRQYVHDNIQTFLNLLNSRKAIDYQMAIVDVDFLNYTTTATPYGSTATAGGLFSAGGVSVVKSKTSANPAADFAGIINVISNTGTSFWEQGLIQSYYAITNFGSQFLRTGVPFNIIYITDDDDWSCKQMLNGTPNCFGIQPENNPDVILYDTGFFINYFKNLKAPESTTTTLFPVVAQSNSTCTVERVGMRYMEVANQVGNYTTGGGLCPDTIGTSLTNIAQTIADRGTKFALSSTSNGKNITVYVNSVAVPVSTTDGYSYDTTSNSIIFYGDAIPANGQVIEVTYEQQSN